jgi:hypothetical protein
MNNFLITASDEAGGLPAVPLPATAWSNQTSVLDKSRNLPLTRLPPLPGEVRIRSVTLARGRMRSLGLPNNRPIAAISIASVVAWTG